MRRVLIAALLLVGGGAPSAWAQLQDYPYGLPIPAFPSNPTGAPSQNVAVIDAASEAFCQIRAATVAKTMRNVHFRLATTTTGGADDLTVGAYTLDASGDPDTSSVYNGAEVAIDIVDGDDNVWKETGDLTASGANAIGDKYAICIRNPAANFGNMQITTFEDVSGQGFPYGDHLTAAWAKSTTWPIVFVEFSDGTFEPLYGSAASGSIPTGTTYNSGTTPAQRGNRLNLAFPCSAVGAWAWVDGDGDFALRLYDSARAGILATTGTHTAAFRQQAGGALYHLPFAASYDLVAGTTYLIQIVPTTVTDIVSYAMDVPDANIFATFGGGTSLYQNVGSSGTGTDTTTSRIFAGIYCDAFGTGGRRRVIGG